jgi:hypothetical protein
VGDFDWGRSVDDAIKRARAQEYLFWRRGRDGALARFRSTRDIELLVDGHWVRIVKPLKFHRWERLGDQDLRAHAHGFLVNAFADRTAADLSTRERLRWLGPMRVFRPPLPGGAEKSLPDSTILAAGRHCAEQIPTSSAESLAEIRDHALLGHTTLADRCAVLEQRANFFLGAVGLTSSLVLANSGLLLGDGHLEAPWLAPALVFLVIATVSAVIAGVMAMLAAMATFIRTTPNGAMQIIDRTGLPVPEVTQLYIGALLVAQKREEVIGTWKLGRLKTARHWFLVVILGVAALTVVVVLASAGSGGAS